jgi:hypothetical protein
MHVYVVNQVDKLQELYTEKPSYYFRNDDSTIDAYIRDIAYIYSVISNFFYKDTIISILEDIICLDKGSPSDRVQECIVIMYMMSIDIWDYSLPCYDLKYYPGGDMMCVDNDTAVLLHVSMIKPFFPSIKYFPKMPIFVRLKKNKYKCENGRCITGEGIFRYFSMVDSKYVQTFSFLSTIIPNTKVAIGSYVSKKIMGDIIDKINSTNEITDIQKILFMDHFIYTVITNVGSDNFELGYSSMNLLDSIAKKQFINDISNKYISNYIRT